MLQNKGEKNLPSQGLRRTILATSEIYGSHGIPIYIHTFTDKLQQVLHGLDEQIIDNGIKPASSQRYSHRLIQRVNINEEGSEGQKIRIRTGMI